MKTLILTPNKKEMCGMFQLAKDLAKEFDGDIVTKKGKYHFDYVHNQVITLLYPMHKWGKLYKKEYGLKWICYDQKIPPITKQNFPNFFRRQYMRWFTWVNERSKQGADEYWDVTEREQKPRWTEKNTFDIDYGFDYALYLGRKTDYKNFDWLNKTMNELYINLVASDNWTDDLVYRYLSNAKLLVTASTWEGYGRPVMEAQALNIPVVCFDTGVHKKLVKNGFVVPNGDFKMFKEKVKEVWENY